MCCGGLVRVPRRKQQSTSGAWVDAGPCLALTLASSFRGVAGSWEMADPEKQMVVEDGSDHEDLSSDDEAPGAGGHANASSLLQDPAVMAALQGKLGAMVGTPSGYVASLPAPVRRRIKALKKLQLEATKIEAKFYEEVRQGHVS